LDACVLGFEHLKSLYTSDKDFGELYLACLKHLKDDYLIQDGYLSKVQGYIFPSVAYVSC